MADAHLRLDTRRQRLGCQRGEGIGAKPKDNLREEVGEVRLETHGTRHLASGPSHPLGEEGGHLLVGAVLQQPREEQISRLKEGEVLLVLDLATGQQSGGLEVEQGRGDDEELRCLVQVPLRALRAQIGDELVGDDVKSELGDLQLVLGDELQEQIERSLERPHADGEARPGGRVTRGGVHVGLVELIAGHGSLRHLAMSSRASCR